jgi:hypothetical protein
MRPLQAVSAFLLVLWLHAPGQAGSETPSKMELAGGQSVAESAAVASGEKGKTISLDVEAADKAGAWVSNLHAGDFTVLDNGHPQDNASVQAVSFTGAQNEGPVEIILAIDAINMGKEALTEEFD